MTMPSDGGRLRLDKRAIADKAARAVLNDNVTLQDAMGRFRIGRHRLRKAIVKLQAERAARSGAP